MNHADSQAELAFEASGHIRISGVLDYQTVPVLWSRYRTQLAALPLWEIDLADVKHANSGGLALLIAWLREAQQLQKPVRFLNIPEQMLQVARMSELEGILVS